MSKQPSPADSAAFTPVAVRPRHDGWTPEKQHGFIAALAESGCVTEACAAVGRSARSAYALRARPDASTFRQAWDVALDYAVRRIGDAAFSRALHGVSRPIFYQGEQVGERRHYDERLVMFLLRYRDPVRYGAWLDGYEARRHPDGAGIVLAHALNAVLDAAHGQEAVVEAPTHDAAGDPITGPPARPAIADGPIKPERPVCEDYDGPEDLRELFESIRAYSDSLDNADLLNDPTTDDWGSVLPVRRSRRRSDYDVP